jgi:hypothetical protein
MALPASFGSRPVTHTFHALVHLQGYSFGPRRKMVLERGDIVIFKIRLVVTAPATVAYIHGRIECRI